MRSSSESTSGNELSLIDSLAPFENSKQRQGRMDLSILENCSTVNLVNKAKTLLYERAPNPSLTGFAGAPVVGLNW